MLEEETTRERTVRETSHAETKKVRLITTLHDLNCLNDRFSDRFLLFPFHFRSNCLLLSLLPLPLSFPNLILISFILFLLFLFLFIM